MQRIICVPTLLTLIAAATPLIAQDDAVQKELKALQGSWKAVALEAGGQQFPNDALPDFTFVIGADGKCTGKMPQSEYTAKLTIDPSKDPKTMDNLHETGTEKGKTQYGVYKLERDKLTVCISRPGRAKSDRPKDFTTKDTRNVLFEFKRIKEAPIEEKRP